jgi:hypothetical protein
LNHALDVEVFVRGEDDRITGCNDNVMEYFRYGPGRKLRKHADRIIREIARRR